VNCQAEASNDPNLVRLSRLSSFSTKIRAEFKFLLIWRGNPPSCKVHFPQIIDFISIKVNKDVRSQNC
jgi:hypothetical protein